MVKGNISKKLDKLASDTRLITYAAPELAVVPGFNTASKAVGKGAHAAAKALR